MIDKLPGISEAVSGMHQGRLSPIELMEFCLGQIDRFDGELGAWQCVDSRQAMHEAEQCAAEAQDYAVLPPLYGIPIGIKDIIDVAGFSTRGGWNGSSGGLAEQDAPSVQRLRQAGAIIVGKTTTTQLACFDPSHTRNPWNPDHTPGGSSSGSAAAVALGMCMGALGTQTGGSIIRPAAYCGVCGLKPWFGAVSNGGVIPVSEWLDHVGPIAAGIRDLIRIWEALAPAGDDDAEFVENGTDLTVGAPLLAVVERAFEKCDETTRRMARKSLDRFRDAGAQCIEFDLPPLFDDVLVMHRRLMAVGIAATYAKIREQNPTLFGPSVTTLIDEGLKVSAVEFVQAQREQRKFQDELRRIVPRTVVLVSPATMTPAPAGLETTGDPTLNSPWSFGGLPACTLPMGLSDNGLPCGLQLIGTGSELELLKWAAWCERHLEFQARPRPGPDYS